MSKVMIVYWSGTGNTKMMADALAEGVKGAGADVALLDVGDADPKALVDYDRLAFGCPSMGAEELEESEMEPFFAAAQTMLTGKKVALFGSYDWGDGEWMRSWEKRAEKNGASLCGEGLILNLTPDDNGLAQCRQLGANLVTM